MKFTEEYFDLLNQIVKEETGTDVQSGPTKDNKTVVAKLVFIKTLTIIYGISALKYPKVIASYFGRHRTALYHLFYMLDNEYALPKIFDLHVENCTKIFLNRLPIEVLKERETELLKEVVQIQNVILERQIVYGSEVSN